jgi:glutamate N-acetyltransferase/amino-acid N-acetyltransferase
MTVQLPLGFHSHVANIGIKDTTDDFTLVVADANCAAAGVFTQSRFAGPSVVVSREHIANLSARAVVVISKNANVATGAEGMSNAREVVSGVATALACVPTDVLIASTGVIGRQYPMDHVRSGLKSIPKQFVATSAEAVATGIMTTDTVQKVAETTISGSSASRCGTITKLSTNIQWLLS